jgi:peptidoglycan/LPS O-acetylase OafA/YrhL
MMRGSPAKVIPALTGLRGIAALWVVLFHLYGPIGSPMSKGYLGVDVFFILSGFVLSLVYAEKFKHITLDTYFSFLKARVARIFPLHLATLSFLGLLAIELPGFANAYPMPHERFGISSFIASALLIQNWFYWLPTCWNTPAWSLSAEWAAYLAFPAFALFTQHWRSIPVTLLLAASSLGVFIAICTFRGVTYPDGQGTLGMARMATEFCCGCLIFRAQALGMQILPKWVEVFAIALLGVSLFVPGAIFLSLFGLALIVLLAGQSSGPIAKFLSFRPMVLMGEISYSIYLVHWILIQISTWAWPSESLSWVQICARDAGVITFTLLISYGTYVSIELRARAWARTIGVKPKIMAANADAI